MNLSTIEQEFTGLDLGDLRLDRRINAIATRLVNAPSASFPTIFPKESELEGFYRILRNPRVQFDSLLDPHISETINRINQTKETLVIHDSSNCIFPGSRKNLEDQQDGAQFLGHFSFAVEPKSGRPLGMLRAQTWVRNKELTPTALRKKGLAQELTNLLPSEMDRWFEAINESTITSGNPAKLIHVADSEGDDYKLLANLLKNHYRFVIRGSCDRRIFDSSDSLRQVLKKKAVIAQCSVTLSKRKGKRLSGQNRNQPREKRDATLEIRSAEISLQRPKKCQSYLPESLMVNIVYVVEVNPNPEHEPVEWILLTNESVATTDLALRIINIYRRRWLIEEYFKALKTGCSYEARQLESYATLKTCLALFIPVAWVLLYMRFEAQQDTDVPAQQVLPAVYLQVLQAQMKKSITTGKEALLALASLGGHIKNNGQPGWLVLWRGYEKLAILVEGYLLAQNMFSKDVINH